MLSEQERRYLYWVANKYYQEIGEMVEVGTWLGGSTACLASGLTDRNSQQLLTCYDNYIWTKSYESKAGGLRLQDGADFQPVFNKLINQRFNNVRSFKSCLSEICWTGKPIEILFLDAPKNKEDMINAVKIFFPVLIPGVSTIIFQDFFYAPAYEVAATVFKMGKALELIHIVENASTAAFRFISSDNIEYDDLDYSSNSTSEITDNFREAIKLLPQTSGDFLNLSLAMLLCDRGRDKDATEVLLDRHMSDIGLRRYKYLSTVSHLKLRYKSIFNLDMISNG